ncbi:uncharacterized protein LOC126902227 [Daktulosphaira vitifoliae]|uniref:uncharacterized protein LOC126902227 n=1 Tax=Daktulosphaira vitifoliae TaxID=58002 RepID=UPI0021AA7D38|nr:uncharacterized protein LOC126902227 [Daktulosphaira vitifoliae]
MSIVTPVLESELHEVKEIKRLYDLFDIKRVDRIINPQMYGIYSLRKSEMEYNHPDTPVNECMLYHVTSKSNLLSIIDNNLNWRLSYRNRYGKGVCFAESPLYAYKYASCTIDKNENFDDNIMFILLRMGFPKEAAKKAIYYTQNRSLELATKWLLKNICNSDIPEPFSMKNNNMPHDRVMLICTVLVQKIKYVDVDYHLKVLPNMYDTAISNNNMVYVKFMDHEYFPKYVAYFKNL